jgi:hypothetical protein
MDGLDGSFGSVPLQSDDGDKSYQDDGRERRSPTEEKEQLGSFLPNASKSKLARIRVVAFS